MDQAYLRERIESRAWRSVLSRHYVVHYDPGVLAEGRAREFAAGAEKRLKVIMRRLEQPYDRHEKRYFPGLNIHYYLDPHGLFGGGYVDYAGLHVPCPLEADDPASFLLHEESHAAIVAVTGSAPPSFFFEGLACYPQFGPTKGDAAHAAASRLFDAAPLPAVSFLATKVGITRAWAVYDGAIHVWAASFAYYLADVGGIASAKELCAISHGADPHIERHVKEAFGRTLKQLDAGWRRMLREWAGDLARIKPLWAEKLGACARTIDVGAARRLCARLHN